MAKSFYTNTEDREWYRRRLICAIIIVAVSFSVIIVRLFQLQAIEGAEYRRLSEHNCIRLQSIPPSRGLIYDADGTLMVDNRPAYNLKLVVKDADPLEETLEKLARIIDVSAEELMETILSQKNVPAYQPVLLREDIDREAVAAIEVNSFDLPGVSVDIESRRQYIFGKTAAHLLGYIGEISEEELDRQPQEKRYRAGDLIGKFGVERAFDEFLRGVPGGRQVEVNAAGQVVRVLHEVPAKAGGNLRLTLDQRLQQKAEELIRGIAAAVVAMEPNRGGILALAGSPSFDPNVFVGGLSGSDWDALISLPWRPMENKAVQGEYAPASTYKIVTAIAGLEEGVINERTRIFCPGYYPFGNRIFRCWRLGGHGTMDVKEALSQSCDVFFYQVGQKLGVDRLALYAKELGLGRSTGIPLDRESSGLIPTAAWKRKRFGVPWVEGETLSLAIGQGYNLVTPLQMAVLTSAVANGGTVVEPKVVSRFEPVEPAGNFRAGHSDPSGPSGPAAASAPDKLDKPGRQLSWKPENLAIVREGIWRVVNGPRGTARVARLDGVEISGKTGTGQVVGRKDGATGQEKDAPAHYRAHAWFVAYAPADAPEIAISVLVENGEHGSGAAAPIARELIRCYLDVSG